MVADELRKWFIPISGSEKAESLIFCLPYAGGSAAAYREWVSLADRLDVRVIAVELPGHGRRVGEASRIDTNVLADAVARYVDRPYRVFGHCSGGWLAFELCRDLRDAGHAEPLNLWISGVPGPRLPRIGWGESRLPEAEFLARVSALGGPAAAILAVPELRELFLPVIRADFEWSDAYEYVPGTLLGCPITAFAGSADPEAPRDRVAEWEAETTGAFRMHVITGDHFFLDTRREEILDLMALDLR